MVKDKAVIINKIKKYIKALEKNITIYKVSASFIILQNDQKHFFIVGVY